jgi:hypothetical protein
MAQLIHIYSPEDMGDKADMGQRQQLNGVKPLLPLLMYWLVQ